MGSLIAFSCVLLMVFCGGPVRCGKHDGDDPSAAVYTANSGTYVSTYDHLDVNRLLKNDKLVSAYIRCFLGEGPCTAEGKQVKAVLLPEIISTVCGKCSPRQRNMARQVLTHIYVHRRPDFERIMKIYDKNNKYNEIIDFMNGSGNYTQ